MPDSPQSDSSPPEPGSSDQKTTEAENANLGELEPAPSFFAELKRRKVYRVAVTYAVVAWLIIQVASNTFSSFGVPDWVFRFIVIGLVLCFPVAIVLAWAFDITPEGVRLTPTADRGEGEEGQGSKRLWLPVALATIVPTVVFGGLAVYFFLSDPNAVNADYPRYESAERPYVIGSLAVLPFQLIGEGALLTSKAEGLHEELTTQLSHMTPLDVVSRTSSLAYRDAQTSAREIGDELQAEFVLEGSLQKSGDEFRLTLQLIETRNDLHLESRTFDRPLASEDALQAQNQLAWDAAIAVYRRLFREFPPLGKSEKRYATLKDEKKTDLDALEAEFWNNDGDGPQPASLEPALEAAVDLIAFDPLDGDAYRQQLMFKGQEMQFHPGRFGAWVEEMELLVYKALQMDPGHFDTQIHMGSFYMYGKGRPDLALPFFQKGLQLYEANAEFEHNWPYYHLSRALLLTGSPALSLEVLERAPDPPELDQLDYWTSSFEFSRQFGKGIIFLDTQLERAAAANDELAMLRIGLVKAQFGAWWGGSLEPLEAYYKSIEDVPAATEGFKAKLLFELRHYEETLAMLETLDTASDPFALNPFELVQIRGVALGESGQLALANSYLRRTISEIQQDLGMIMIQPGMANTALSALHAYLGDREAALAAMERAEAHLDATRNLPLFYVCQGMLVYAFLELEEMDQAIDKLETMLSGLSGSSSGRILIDFREKDLYANPRFQSLIRKYAHHLKDPAILERIFQTPK